MTVIGAAPNPCSLAHRDDAALLTRLHDLVAQEQQQTAPLLAHLAEVDARDQERCAFVEPRSGKRCTATARLHFHHRQPWARGATDDQGNLTLYCAAHDALQAELDYGARLVADRIAARRAAAAGGAAATPARGSAAAPGDSPARSPSG